MKIYHGNLFYAVSSRDVGTFGGKAKQVTIKIYHGNNANSPACILDQFAQISEFEGFMKEHKNNRQEIDKIIAEFVKFGG